MSESPHPLLRVPVFLQPGGPTARWGTLCSGLGTQPCVQGCEGSRVHTHLSGCRCGEPVCVCTCVCVCTPGCECLEAYVCELGGMCQGAAVHTLVSEAACAARVAVRMPKCVSVSGLRWDGWTWAGGWMARRKGGCRMGRWIRAPPSREAPSASFLGFYCAPTPWDGARSPGLTGSSSSGVHPGSPFPRLESGVQKPVGREWPVETWEGTRPILGALEPGPPGGSAFCSPLPPDSSLSLRSPGRKRRTSVSSAR